MLKGFFYFLWELRINSVFVKLKIRGMKDICPKKEKGDSPTKGGAQRKIEGVFTWGKRGERPEGRFLPCKRLFHKIYYYPSSNPPSNRCTNLICEGAGPTDRYRSSPDPVR